VRPGIDSISRMDSLWTDKIVIVTGGAGGMGQAAAKRFAEAGAQTFIFGRTLESLQEAAALSPRIVPVVCDVSDSISVGTAMAQVLAHGAPHVLIHTAGINTPDRFMAHADPARIASAETWQRVMDINVLGVVNMIQAVTQPMAANGGGKIVVVSSTAGHGFDSYAGVPYTASKWAVHGLLFTARAQLSAQGIVLSEYAPGEANTPIVDKRPVLPTPEHRVAMIQTADCAQALFFIASQAHSMSIIQLPAYQPFGGMPPAISAPWLAGLSIKPM
jgi:NAD(P)-dependent dehydrogenase (short-subunit alcohol dehydrogenase family)